MKSAVFLGCMAMQEYRYPLLFLLLWRLRDGKNVGRAGGRRIKGQKQCCYIVSRYRRSAIKTPDINTR